MELAFFFGRGSVCVWGGQYAKVHSLSQPGVAKELKLDLNSPMRPSGETPPKPALLVLPIMNNNQREEITTGWEKDDRWQKKKMEDEPELIGFFSQQVHAFSSAAKEEDSWTKSPSSLNIEHGLSSNRAFYLTARQ